MSILYDCTRWSFIVAKAIIYHEQEAKDVHELEGEKESDYHEGHTDKLMVSDRSRAVVEPKQQSQVTSISARNARILFRKDVIMYRVDRIRKYRILQQIMREVFRDRNPYVWNTTMAGRRRPIFMRLEEVRHRRRL